MVIDNYLPRQPLISSYVPDWPLPPHVYIPSESEMALRARIYAYNRHLSFDVAFICSTLTHCGVCHLSVWRLKWEVSYVHQSVWRWKWFFCQSSYVLQWLRLCRTSDTVFRREIDSRRQWGYGTCYGGSFPTEKECNYCYKYVDRPFCLRTDDLWHVEYYHQCFKRFTSEFFCTISYYFFFSTNELHVLCSSLKSEFLHLTDSFFTLLVNINNI